MTQAPAPRVVSLVASDVAGLGRLDQYLTAHVPGLSRAQAQRLIREGHVRVSSGLPKPSLAVTPGLRIELTPPPLEAATPAPEAMPLVILHDDADLVVVNKPAGLVVHPGAGHRTGTLVNALLHHVGGLSGIGGAERPGIVHRLDRGTSGVMVIAKHDRAHRSLSAQFHDRRVGKEYLALVWGTPRAGLDIDRPIGRDPRHRQKMSSRARRTRTAATRVVTVEPLGGVSLARVRITTGRTHQIRVHLSEIGHPVVGDALYGGVRQKLPPALAPVGKLGRPFLHAATLSFDQPTTQQRLTFEAPLPADLAAMVDRLRLRRAVPVEPA